MSTVAFPRMSAAAPSAAASATAGRVALVTGANTGIGKDTALGLARAGYHVFVACRSEAKARDAIASIKVCACVCVRAPPSGMRVVP